MSALLVRLYLNAQVYIGEDHYTECAQVAQDILDGKYGKYQVAPKIMQTSAEYQACLNIIPNAVYLLQR